MTIGEAQTLSPEEIEEGQNFLRNKHFGRKQWRYYASKYLG
jgi:hypothetical protein